MYLFVNIRNGGTSIYWTEWLYGIKKQIEPFRRHHSINTTVLHSLSI